MSVPRVKNIPIDKMNITSGQRATCLEYIQKMAFAKTETEYNGIYNQFMNTAPEQVKTYFDSNWNPIKEEWVMGFKFSTGNFF